MSACPRIRSDRQSAIGIQNSKPSLSPVDDASDTPSSADRTPDAYTPAWSKCPHARGSDLIANRRSESKILSLRFRPWMMLLIHRLQPIERQMRIHLRGRNVRMPEDPI